VSQAAAAARPVVGHYASMPSVQFFAHVGLFIRSNFLEPSACADLQTTLAQTAWTSGKVARDSQPECLDESVRKVRRLDVDRALWTSVRERLWALKPELERHFHCQLTSCDGPDFLAYDRGAFYAPHADCGVHYQTRRVSVVIFLNDARDDLSEPAGTAGYAGGELTFLGLLSGPAWENCPLPLSGQAGLLVAFSSDIVHEVKPVTSGQRYTIVGWFSS
jgi:predicted 2-oxoglutarate/Fe(II)-dependent dioxygenase YbiX